MRRGRRPIVTAALLGTLAAVLLGAQRSPAVPPPEAVLGFEPCADYTLATYEQIAAYFRVLDAASDRLQLVDIGTTAEGRTQLMAVITSEANMARLSRYKDIARMLAQARGPDGQPIDDETARRLAEEGKPIVWIDFGLHSNEVAAAQTAPWLAWQAVADDTEEMQAVRDRVVLLLVPNMNPDGTTLVADWYMTHVRAPWEMSLPVLYHKYAGHDNNRDFFMFTQPETRNVGRQLYEEWFPQIVYDQHQTAPFPARIFVPPFENPTNFNIPPLVMRGINSIGDAITRRLEREGKVGAISHVQFDAWWNGGMRTAPYFHNMIGILTETAHASATPATYDRRTFPRRFANGESTTEPSTFYPSPYLGGRWTLRMSCEYMMTASMAVLDMGASRPSEWLYDVYRMARSHIEAGANETYVVPADQWDPGAAARLIDTLRLGAVDVERATAPFTAEGRTYGAGSYVIRGAQPYLPYVRDLLNPQIYPDRRLYPDGPPEPPYDISGWTLPLQMGVRVDRLAASVAARTERVDRVTRRPGRVSGAAGAAYAIDPRSNDAYVAVNRLLAAGDRVTRAANAFSAGGVDWPAGTFVVAAATGATERVTAAATALGVDAVALDRTPPGTVSLSPPRVGLYAAWGGNPDEGWTRWVLEQYEFPYTTLRDADIRAGNLRARFDVILLPDATYTSMLNGFAPGTMPPEYVGGMTARGVANLYAFVVEGGTLVAQDRASELPLVTFGLPVRNVLETLPTSEFFAPGTLLRIEVDTTQPLGWGLPKEAAAFFIRSPAFEVGYGRGRPGDPRWADVPPPPGVRVLATYPEEDPLLSGWMVGEQHLRKRAAVVEAAVDRGRVVLLGFRTQHRGQPHGTFKFLFNAIYLGASRPLSRTASTDARQP
jgi:hypothetical protein